MPSHEYKVVPAPERAAKVRGLKGAALFAHEVETLMNQMAAEGWHYLRADVLPHQERSGLASRTTTDRNLLIFQRSVAAEDAPAAAGTPGPALPAFRQLRADPPVATPPGAPAGAAPEPPSGPPSETPQEPPALFPNRQGKGVDL